MDKKDYRKMSNAELEIWRKNIGGKGLGDPGEAHRRALQAIQHPIRREILVLLKDQNRTLEEMVHHLNLDEKTFRYHLQYLRDIAYVTLEGNNIDLTPIGVAYTRNAMR